MGPANPWVRRSAARSRRRLRAPLPGGLGVRVPEVPGSDQMSSRSAGRREPREVAQPRPRPGMPGPRMRGVGECAAGGRDLDSEGRGALRRRRSSAANVVRDAKTPDALEVGAKAPVIASAAAVASSASMRSRAPCRSGPDHRWNSERLEVPRDFGGAFTRVPPGVWKTLRRMTPAVVS